MAGKNKKRKKSIKPIKKKLKSSDIIKINARYAMKLEEYGNKTLEELKEIYNTSKLSFTDKSALIEATDIKLSKESEDVLVEASKREIKESYKDGDKNEQC